MSQERDLTHGGVRSTGTAFKWICPYCGTRRVDQYAEGMRGEGDALGALRSHIEDAAGDGHGPRNEVPEDGERTLLGYVCRVDGRG
jgi:hypothetical protein